MHEIETFYEENHRFTIVFGWTKRNDELLIVFEMKLLGMTWLHGLNEDFHHDHLVSNRYLPTSVLVYGHNFCVKVIKS